MKPTINQLFQPRNTLTTNTTTQMRTISIFLVLAFVSVFALTADAQNPAPFAGGVKLQQGGGTNPAFGLTLTSKPTFTANTQLNFIQPTSGGIMKIINFGANAGDVSVTTLDLSSASDVGSSVLGILNGGTGASTANGALNNLLPSQSSNGGKFLTTDGTNASWTSAVTSVGLSMPSIFTVSNSPVTTTGTLTATLASQAANTVFAAPDGASGTPSFRAIVSGDITSLDATKITGTLAVANGGTGVTSLAPNGVLTANSSGDGIVSTPLTDGQIMVGSTGFAPVATTITAGTGITVTNGAGSITIAADLANASNKAIIPLSASQYSYTANDVATIAPGFVLSATSVITITVMEAGGYAISATVTNIDIANNKFDFVISGYPTAGSKALVHFQN